MNNPDKSATRFELEDALRKEGCAVCRLVDRAGRSYLDNLLYEQVNDGEAQKEFRNSLGLCELHARRMLGTGDGLGTAILYRTAIRELLELLPRVPNSPRSRSPLHVLLGCAEDAQAIPEPGEGCMICQAEVDAERRYLNSLVAGAEDGSLENFLDGSATICIRHLSRASALTGGWLPHALIEATEAIIKDISSDLDQYVRHNDYRFSGEPWGRERDVNRRTVKTLLGWRSA